jgi:cardiolipin synthase C
VLTPLPAVGDTLPPASRPGMLAGRVAALAFALGLLTACATLPLAVDYPLSIALTDTTDTCLGRAIEPLAAAHPGASGIFPLPNAHDAFAARVLMARVAERSLDIQYYIWHTDHSGTLLFQELVDAADRGVRVRLLLDDNNTAGLDPLLAGLDSHPNIEVRLFNPLAARKPRVVNYLNDFGRLNRRMHNKSFTADNQATIVGGRNVGDEYFGATEGMAFADLDVIAVGPVVREVSSDFDRYWASPSVYPVDRVLPPAEPGQAEELAKAAVQVQADPAAALYREALQASTFIRELADGRLGLEWAATRLVSDDPAKGLGQAPPGALLLRKLKEIIGDPEGTLDLVSPYFVPTASGVDALAALAKRGVRVRVLTNALEATDVAAVHAGYAKRRKPLLEAGILLYEMRRSADAAPRQAGLSGSAGTSLHAKTFAVDGRCVFVGSFNFDPRSARLNTEMGFVIQSPALARQIAAAFDTRIPFAAYEVRLSESGKLIWIERSGGLEVVHDSEPGTGFWRRAWVGFLSILPIEKHL